jgi:hypothetical protein
MLICIFSIKSGLYLRMMGNFDNGIIEVLPWKAGLVRAITRIGPCRIR